MVHYADYFVHGASWSNDHRFYVGAVEHFRTRGQRGTTGFDLVNDRNLGYPIVPIPIF